MPAGAGQRRAAGRCPGCRRRIGEEPHPPYDRPPLSKQILTGTWKPERATLRSLLDLARIEADLRLGQRATALDVAGGEVRLGILRAVLLTGPRVVVVGAGFLGAEVAAAARTMGLEVTVVEPEPVPVRCPFGARVADLHRDHSTRLRCGTSVRRLRGAGGRVTGVELGDGTTLPADVVVLALGSTPATGWLTGSSLRLRDGVECDALCRAAPGI